MTSPPRPIAREQGLILASLLALAAAAWLVLLQQSLNGETAMGGMTMGLEAPLFLTLWVVMMAAMMFPTAAPMILTFARIHENRRQRGSAFVPTWVFVAPYLAIWTLFGAVIFAFARGAEIAVEGSALSVDIAARVGGGAFILAGVYQLTPLKSRCLAKCRSPLGFILDRWRDGYAGALRMGLQHGAYCLGCCWLLFVILFPLGVMNVAAMAVITLFIFAEKSLPHGRLIGRAAALAMMAYGLLVVGAPTALPTILAHGEPM